MNQLRKGLSHIQHHILHSAAAPSTPLPLDDEQGTSMLDVVSESDGSSRYLWGNSKHPRSRCPAKDATCAKCQKRGQYAKVCRRKAFSRHKVSAATCISTVQIPKSLLKSIATVNKGGLHVESPWQSNQQVVLYL